MWEWNDEWPKTKIKIQITCLHLCWNTAIANKIFIRKIKVPKKSSATQEWMKVYEFLQEI